MTRRALLLGFDIWSEACDSVSMAVSDVTRIRISNRELAGVVLMSLCAVPAVAGFAANAQTVLFRTDYHTHRYLHTIRCVTVRACQQIAGQRFECESPYEDGVLRVDGSSCESLET
jgi:hypothetical protein